MKKVICAACRYINLLMNINTSIPAKIAEISLSKKCCFRRNEYHWNFWHIAPEAFGIEVIVFYSFRGLAGNDFTCIYFLWRYITECKLKVIKPG